MNCQYRKDGPRRWLLDGCPHILGMVTMLLPLSKSALDHVLFHFVSLLLELDVHAIFLIKSMH